MTRSPCGDRFPTLERLCKIVFSDQKNVHGDSLCLFSCQTKHYPQDLPTASVVIVFKNERWSPVLRTVYSVLNRSPSHLLKEVILVDDQSDIGEEQKCTAAEVTNCFFSEEMGKRLDDYCEENFGDLVKILRAPERLGLIKAKNFGARAGRSIRFAFQSIVVRFSYWRCGHFSRRPL